MTSLEITATDAFLDMPQSSQLLYFHLNSLADDDGFVANPRSIMRNCGAQADDLKLLIAKKFVIAFEDGVCVIKHWRINNFVRKDIYKETKYLDLKSALLIRPNGAYTLNDDGKAVPLPAGHFTLDYVNDALTERQLRLGKVREGKDSTVKDIVAANAATPADEAREFFSGGKVYQEVLQALSVKIPQERAERELEKFTLYWTEKNTTGTKQRWQQERTFEVKRRLYTWLSRVKETRQHITKGKDFV